MFVFFNCFDFFNVLNLNIVIDLLDKILLSYILINELFIDYYIKFNIY